MWLVVELIPGPLQFTSGQKSKSDHGIRGPQKVYFQVYIIHCHGPTGFALGEAKEVLLLQILGDHGREISFIYIYNTKCIS